MKKEPVDTPAPAEAEQTPEAIRNGEVDALIVNGAAAPQIFTLKGSELPYRLMVEQMTEGTLMLSKEGTILYANHAFAQLAAGRWSTSLERSSRHS